MKETKTGVIINLRQNGYGFIQSEEEKDSIFFHASGVIEPSFQELREGNIVDYLEVDSTKGKKAIGIVISKGE